MMNFISFQFLIFIIILVTILHFVKDNKKQHIVLIIASYIFYALADIRFLGLLIALSVFTWFIGQKIESGGNKKATLIVGISVDLIILGIFKYFNFFVGSVCELFGREYNSLKILLPVGISFYIFQSISYIADIYKKRIKAEGLINTLLYIGFFPKMISGPIVKARDFLPQLQKAHIITWDNISYGIQRFALGMFKKLVIADRLGVCVDAVYSCPAAYSGLSIMIAVISYSLQIYYDFAGYSDMAIGVGHILGFDLGENFNLPYLSKNPSEFWKRWHISLSSWFTEYVYIPLGGNRRGKIRTCLNITITMLLSGLWHGASWSYVVWGALFALGQVIHKLFDYLPVHRNKKSRIVDTICIAVNFCFTSLLWIPFRTNDSSKTILICKRLFSWSNGISYIYVFSIIFVVLLLVVELIALVKNNGNNIWKPLNFGKFGSKVVFCTFVLLIVVFAYVGNGAFIYSGF